MRDTFPPPLRESLKSLATAWVDDDNTQRLWDGDESLWTSSGESDWLGWLAIVDEIAADTSHLKQFAGEVRGRYSHAVLLGMGGSSLCPEVLRLCFGPQEGFPDFRILDSTHPGQIAACEESVCLDTTLFIAASKSGSTLETALLTDYFLDRLAAAGAERPGVQFVAITDPGSALEAKARELGFAHVFHGIPSIGGRYSALSNFGMVPAAAMGLNVDQLLAGAGEMRTLCGPEYSPEDYPRTGGPWGCIPPPQNPGAVLGLALSACALAGRDKLTFVCSPGVAALGAWIEQLVAESTGKAAKGIVPIDGETLDERSKYSSDRVFVSLELSPKWNTDTRGYDPPDAMDKAKATRQAIDELQELGHPTLETWINEIEDLGGQFFLWEMATAIAGSVLEINPFDQPDVESAKVAARELTSAYGSEGSLPAPKPFLEEAGIELFAAPEYAERLQNEGRGGVVSVLRSHLSAAGEGDYLALLAYVNRNQAAQTELDRMRNAIRKRSGLATTVGFGPRFLHSTGQLHKGGPASGVFIQIGCDVGQDIPVPGRKLSFGVVAAAQALGDFSVLAGLGRRALRIHLRMEQDTALPRLADIFAEAAQ